MELQPARSNPRGTFEPRPPSNDIGGGELLILAVLLFLGGGVVYFFTKLLGKTMAIAIACTLALAGVLWAVAPIYGLATLILGIPLAVGIVRGLESKPPPPASR